MLQKCIVSPEHLANTLNTPNTQQAPTQWYPKVGPQENCNASAYSVDFPIRSKGTVYIPTFLSTALGCCIRDQGLPSSESSQSSSTRMPQLEPPRYPFFPSTKGQTVKTWEVAELFALHWNFFLRFMKMFGSPLFWGLLWGWQLHVAASRDRSGAFVFKNTIL